MRLIIRTGLRAELELITLLDGELAFCTDTNELFIGLNGRNEIIGG